MRPQGGPEHHKIDRLPFKPGSMEFLAAKNSTRGRDLIYERADDAKPYAEPAAADPMPGR